MGNQIELDQTITITITDGDSVPVSLDDIGNGQYVYGQFTDDHNYVGASSYLQEKEAFPEKFTADICIDEVRILSDREVNRDVHSCELEIFDPCGGESDRSVGIVSGC